jgi:hypothetical protein
MTYLEIYGPTPNVYDYIQFEVDFKQLLDSWEYHYTSIYDSDKDNQSYALLEVRGFVELYSTNPKLTDFKSHLDPANYDNFDQLYTINAFKSVSKDSYKINMADIRTTRTLKSLRIKHIPTNTSIIHTNFNKGLECLRSKLFHLQKTNVPTYQTSNVILPLIQSYTSPGIEYV